MKIYRPLWNEGALLSPQQFQQQAQWEAFTNQGVSGFSSPFTWGWKKLSWMNRFYRQVACKFTNYGCGCQMGHWWIRKSVMSLLSRES